MAEVYSFKWEISWWSMVVSIYQRWRPFLLFFPQRYPLLQRGYFYSTHKPLCCGIGRHCTCSSQALHPKFLDRQIRWVYSTFFFLFWCKIILCFILLMEKLNCNNTRLWGKHVVRKMPWQRLFNEKILTINVFMPMAFERQYDIKLALITTYLITLFSCFSNISFTKDGDARLEK